LDEGASTAANFSIERDPAGGGAKEKEKEKRRQLCVMNVRARQERSTAVA
jgi:hypothetical protein